MFRKTIQTISMLFAGAVLWTSVFGAVSDPVVKESSSLRVQVQGLLALKDLGDMRRVILAIGSQDVLVSGLIPRAEIEILGASGDHTVVDAREIEYKVGDEVAFGLNYGALQSAMTSPYVSKSYINGVTDQRN